MHFMEVGGRQGLKPTAHPNYLRGAEAPLFHGKAVHGKAALLAFLQSNLSLGKGCGLSWVGL